MFLIKVFLRDCQQISTKIEQFKLCYAIDISYLWSILDSEGQQLTWIFKVLSLGSWNLTTHSQNQLLIYYLDMRKQLWLNKSNVLFNLKLRSAKQILFLLEHFPLCGGQLLNLKLRLKVLSLDWLSEFLFYLWNWSLVFQMSNLTNNFLMGWKALSNLFCCREIMLKIGSRMDESTQ